MIKFIHYEDGSGTMLQIGERLTIYFTNEWKQLFQFGRCNWYSVTPMHLYFEYEAYARMIELTCTLLGFGCTLRYDCDFEHSEIKARADEAYDALVKSRKEVLDTWMALDQAGTVRVHFDDDLPFDSGCVHIQQGAADCDMSLTAEEALNLLNWLSHQRPHLEQVKEEGDHA